MIKLITLIVSLVLVVTVKAGPICEDGNDGLGCLIKLTAFVQVVAKDAETRSGNITFTAYTKSNKWTHIGGSLHQEEYIGGQYYNYTVKVPVNEFDILKLGLTWESDTPEDGQTLVVASPVTLFDE